MKGSIQLTERERKRVLKAYRSGSDVRVARRAHLLLPLTTSHPLAACSASGFASRTSIASFGWLVCQN